MKIARNRRGFTLVELIIVVALISLLSGIAVFSIQTFYDQNVRKATLADLRQLATALEFAHQDMSFYPKLSYLNDPKALLLYDQVNNQPDVTKVIASLDYYGFYDRLNSDVIITRVASKWTGPYGGWSVNRGRSARGGQSGLIKVRIAELAVDPITRPYSVVNWPADNYGHPFVLYQMNLVPDASTGQRLVPSYITGPGNEGDGFNAVVSYGTNKLPGGGSNLADDTFGSFRELLRQQDQFLLGDYWNEDAIYTLRGKGDISGSPRGAIPGLFPTTTAQQERLADSFNVTFWSATGGLPDPNNGIVGMLDTGSDDLIIEF